ncbi:MAG TPA: Gfo/Idh/MocA family oxidoreductase, partial [Pseudolysinimonas sp.]|nr:Gfo/Idh/MocA family oxidoreductase [Pseudolysinimonas sp.]
MTATRWAVIGPGDIARRTVRDIQQVREIDLVGVASRSADRAQAFAGEYGIPRTFVGYDSVFADDDIDVVYIATPHSEHHALVTAALEAGKHVLCEKAFTLDAAQARDLADLARGRGRFLMEAMWMRFSPAVREVQRVVAEGTIGELRFVNAGFGAPFPREPGSRFWTPELGGGALLDLGVYPLTLARVFLGAPTEVRAHGEMLENGVDVDSSVWLGSERGRFAQVASSMTAAIPPSAIFGGTAGYITLDSPIYSSERFVVHVGPDRVEEHHIEVEGAGY